MSFGKIIKYTCLMSFTPTIGINFIWSDIMTEKRVERARQEGYEHASNIYQEKYEKQAENFEAQKKAMNDIINDLKNN